MQYYIKVFNQKNGNLVGFYKETGRTRVSKMKKGMKFFNRKEDALTRAIMLDDAFVRDEDKKYYKSFVAIYGDHTREKHQSGYRNQDYEEKREEEYRSEVARLIRQNYSETSDKAGDDF